MYFGVECLVYLESFKAGLREVFEIWVLVYERGWLDSDSLVIVGKYSLLLYVDSYKAMLCMFFIALLDYLSNYSSRKVLVCVCYLRFLAGFIFSDGWRCMLPSLV